MTYRSVNLLIILAIITAVLLISSWDKRTVLQGESWERQRFGRTLPGEVFIREHMINTDGTLKTNLQPHTAVERGVARGEEALSESLGLWMQYALEKKDPALFAESVAVLKENFMTEDGFISWKLGPYPVGTNALIDDLRIVEGLYRAASEWNSHEYLELANVIAQSIASHQVDDRLLTDFFDRHSEWSSKSLTISYVNPVALTYMYEHNGISNAVYQGTMNFLRNVPQRHGFFPFSYDLQTGMYHYHDQVNLIDQLYVVYHRARGGIASPEVWSFIQNEFARNGLIYGRYFAYSKQPSVSYESPAVYALAILSAVELEDRQFAKDLYYRMIRMQTLNPDSEYFGGYVFDDDAHIFDNLLPLLAERKMYNAQILR